MRSRRISIILMFIICFLVSGGIGCNSRDKYIGTYQAVDSSGKPYQGGCCIELRENGKGDWKRDDEEVPFSWYIKDDELRINTKDGGIIIGSFRQKGIIMILPGEKEIMFKKSN